MRRKYFYTIFKKHREKKQSFLYCQILRNVLGTYLNDFSIPTVSKANAYTVCTVYELYSEINTFLLHVLPYIVVH